MTEYFVGSPTHSDLLQSVHKVRNKEPLSHSVPDLLSISDSNTDEQDKGRVSCCDS